MIAATDVSMRFGQQMLFENVSVKFNSGCRYGLIGANGSGKSTFMKILSGQQDSTTGSVAIDKDCRMGFLKQNHYDYEDVPILDVVYMGNENLWKIHQEREYLYSKLELTEEEEERANDIEGLFGDAGGYTMEADAAKLLVGLGIPVEKHNQPLSSLTGGFKLPEYFTSRLVRLLVLLTTVTGGATYLVQSGKFDRTIFLASMLVAAGGMFGFPLGVKMHRIVYEAGYAQHIHKSFAFIAFALLLNTVFNLAGLTALSRVSMLLIGAGLTCYLAGFTLYARRVRR